MASDFKEDLRRKLANPEFAKAFGAAYAKSEFALTIARARHSARLSQKELAKRLGCSQPYIAKLEGGDANPTLGKVGSMLASLGLRLRMNTVPLVNADPPGTSAGSGDHVYTTDMGQRRMPRRHGAFHVGPTGWPFVPGSDDTCNLREPSSRWTSDDVDTLYAQTLEAF